MRYAVSRVFSRRPLSFISIIIIILLSLFVGVLSVRADVAPPQAPPGANPGVDQITQVRMMDERVVIEIQEEDDVEQIGVARVWAEFNMKNLGSSTERLMVRFPISYNDGFGGYPEIEDLMVYIDNVSVPTSLINLEGDPEIWNDPIKWTEFEVVFPPGEIVEIEVDYTLYGTGYYPYVSYGYLLETGAGWNGTIGSAEIIVRLPYRATTANVLIDEQTGWGMTTPGAVLSENEILWYLEEFEPGVENNINITIVWPSVWQRILDEQRHVYDFPDDGEAWGLLAKHYKEISRFSKGFRNDTGGLFLHEQSMVAYQKALDLLPNDALWHAGYADLLIWHSGWDYGFSTASREEFLDGMYQLYLAYQIDPNNEYIQNYLNSYFLRDAVVEENGEYDFLWLTMTPTLTDIEPQETAAPQADPTAITLVTTTPQLVQTQPPVIEETKFDEGGEAEDVEIKKKSPICGSALLAPFAFGMAVLLPVFRRWPPLKEKK